MTSLTPHHYQRHAENDEIDLRDIAIITLNGWRWIAASVVTCMLLACIYLWFSTSTYTSTLRYTQTSDGLNVINHVPGFAITPLQAKTELEVRLGSFERFRAFLAQHPDYARMLSNENAPEEDTSALRESFRQLSVTSADSTSSDQGEIRYSYPEDVDGASLLNDYYLWSQDQYTRVLIERVERSIQNTIAINEVSMNAHLAAYQDELDATVTRMNEEHYIRHLELQDQLAAEQAAERSSRMERIRTLEQAEDIAARLSIHQPTTPLSMAGGNTPDRVVYDNVSIGSDLPLYFLGTDALSAEREVLTQGLDEPMTSPAIRQIEKQLEQLQHQRRIEAFEARESDSPFIDTYNQLQQENTLLRAKNVTPDDITVTEIVDVAYRPEASDGPGKSLVLALALILGGMMGLMLVMLVTFSRSVKSYRAQYA